MAKANKVRGQLRTKLEEAYFDYLMVRLMEAREKNLTCRLTVNIRSGFIDNINEVNNIAGITNTNHYLSRFDMDTQ